MSLFRGVNVVSIAVPDLRAAKPFYEEILGLGKPVYDLPDDGWIEFSTGGAGNLALTPASPGDTGATGEQRVCVVLTVDDCRAAHATLVARGVRCEEPQVFSGFVTHCTFYDPFGNQLQMCSTEGEEPAA